MRSPSLLLAFAGLTLALAACESSSRPPPQQPWGGPQHPQGMGPHGMGPHGTPPTYAMPWMVGLPPGAAAPAPAPAIAQPASTGAADQDRCLSDAGTAADCESALRAIAAASPAAGPAVPGRVHDVYRRACEKKAKLLSCAVFKSTAVTDADKPQVELLMLCEGGRSEACEDVATKAAPLQAWLSTLKGEHCKKGHQALCKNHRQCKGPTQWGCRPGASGGAAPGAPAAEVCGCVPRQCGGPLTVTPLARTWPDGTQRGQFSCAP